MTGIVQAWPKMTVDNCGRDYCLSTIYSNRTGLVSECKKVRLVKWSKERISKGAAFLYHFYKLSDTNHYNFNKK